METRPRVILAETAGFCFGVDRAVRMTYDLLSANRRVATLGPLIHNPQVVEDLRSKGVCAISGAAEAEPGMTVVIRAHGVPPGVIDALRDAQATVVDATCPFVQKIHRIVESPCDGVWIAGDASHPEVEGIRGCCKAPSTVFANAQNLEELLADDPDISRKEITVVAQTTFSVEEW